MHVPTYLPRVVYNLAPSTKRYVIAVGKETDFFWMEKNIKNTVKTVYTYGVRYHTWMGKKMRRRVPTYIRITHNSLHSLIAYLRPPPLRPRRPFTLVQCETRYMSPVPWAGVLTFTCTYRGVVEPRLS